MLDPRMEPKTEPRLEPEHDRYKAASAPHDASAKR